MSDRLIPLGEIVTTHGIGGWLKLSPYNPETTALTSAHRIYLEKDRSCWAHDLESSKPYKHQFLIKLRGVNGIDDAERWVGFTLCVAENTLRALGPGEYYHYQAIGLEVFNVKGDWIGIITRTWSTPGGELYVVKGATKEHLIPAVREIIEKVDLAAGKMIVNPPEGILDL